MSTYRVLVVDDDSTLRFNIRDALSPFFATDTAANADEAIAKIRAGSFDLIFLDVNMPGRSGLECVREIQEWDPAILIIVMTAFSKVEDAVRAIKEGAYNYLAKPIQTSALVEMAQRAIEARNLVGCSAFSAPVVGLEGSEFVGDSSEMRRVFFILQKLAKVDTSVLIRGESGTGKELVARAIHFNSPRKERKLVAINCSSIPETLFESELFGHERGAFTGADQRKIGKFQYADGGTIFLDEIGDLSLAMQVKLLRVLQERKFIPVGSNREIAVDARIVAATNRDLEVAIREGKFREDLFYRLNVVPVFLPPLRARKADIEKLTRFFLQKFSVQQAKKINEITASALELLEAHSWPGNIRELENAIEYATVLETTERITVASLPEYLRALVPTIPMPEPAPEIVTDLDYRLFREQAEKEFILRALKTFKGRINQTALHAKIPKKTLLRKLQKYAIRAEDFR